MFMHPAVPETVFKAFRAAAADGRRETRQEEETCAIVILHGAARRVRAASFCREKFAVVAVSAVVEPDCGNPPNLGPATVISLFSPVQRQAVAYLTEAGVKVEFLPCWCAADGRWAYQATVALDQF